MIQIYISLFSFFGGILVALIGGWFALSGHRISKANSELQARLTANVELAEFRQIWIDNLRNDMSKFNSLIGTANLKKIEKSNVIMESFEIFTRILLSINPDDVNYGALYESMLKCMSTDSDDDRYDRHDNLIKICQKILKGEWDVLKSEVQSVATIK